MVQLVSGFLLGVTLASMLFSLLMTTAIVDQEAAFTILETLDHLKGS